MAVIIKVTGNSNLKIRELSRIETRRVSTLLDWMDANPICWRKITEYVYNHRLNQKKIKKIKRNKK